MPKPDTIAVWPSTDCPRGQHLGHEERGPVAGGLGTHSGTSPREALTGEDAGLVPIGDALVLAEQEADLAGADTDVARGDVGVLADVAVELGHEGLTKAHDLAVAAALGVEVAAALAAADGHAGQRRGRGPS